MQDLGTKRFKWYTYLLAVGLVFCLSLCHNPSSYARDAEILLPLPGSTLSGAVVEFVWTDVNADQYALDIGSAQGGTDIYSQNLGAATSVTVSGLPTDGRTLHVRLWTVRDDQWNYTDYTYTAADKEDTEIPPLPRLRAQGESFVDEKGRTFRCWGVNLVAFYPDDQTAVNFARNLAERGVNCVRWHHMLRPSPDWITQSDILALNTYEGLEFYDPDDPRARPCPDSDNVDVVSPHYTSRIPDAEAWRRFDFLNARLQEHGIYILLGTHWTRDYGTNDVDVPPFGPDSPDREQWRQAVADLQHRSYCWGYGSIIDLQKMLPAFDERALALEKEFLTTLLNHVNPYTGVAYKDSPQVLTLEITNEFSSIYTIVNGNRYYDDRWTQGFPGLAYFQNKLETQWAAFLTDRGYDYFDLYLEQPSDIPYETRERLRVEFLYGLDQTYYEAIRDHIADLEAQVHVTFSTLWRSEPDTHRSAQEPGITHTENHIYANPAVVEPFLDYPDEDGAFFRDPAHPMEDLFYNLAVTQQVRDKPHIVGEINISAGVDGSFTELLKTRLHKRTMQLLAAAAYGRLHNWAGVVWFAWNHGDARVGSDGWGVNERIPQNMDNMEDRQTVGGNLIEDAVFLDHLRTAGLIFTKGLVAASTDPITLYVEDETDDPLYQYVYGYPVRPKLLPKPGWQNVSAVRKVYGPPPPGYDQDAQPHMTHEPVNPITSDTGQIVKDIARGQLTVDAPQVEAFSGYLDGTPPANLDVLQMAESAGFATVILVAQDDRALEQSRELLISRTYIDGVTSPEDIRQGRDADGPAITLAGLRQPTEGEGWYIRFTRPRERYAESAPFLLQMQDGRLSLPNGPWREAELVLGTTSSFWSRTNPGGGGAFNTIGAGPTGIILAASDLSGAYRSLDGGRTWDAIGSFRGLTVTHVGGLGFDPEDPAILYIGTEEGIFRSDDFGMTFSPVLTHGYVTDIEIAVGNPHVGYAAYHSRYNVADGAVFKTTDRGKTWERVSNASLPNGLHILELIVDWEDEDVVYLLAGEGRFACGPAALYESADGGVTWARLAADLGQIADIALDPNNPNILYLTTYGDVWDPGYKCIADDPGGGHLYRGTFDGSWSWEQLTDESNLGSRNLLIWPDADDDHAIRVIDMDYPELWESTDGGVTWDRIGSKEDWDPGWASVDFAYGMSFNGDAKTLGLDLSDPDALLWADSQFVYATRDDGRTFAPLHTDEVASGKWRSRGVDNIVPFDLAINADSTHVYLAMPDLGCFRSDDYGSSWQNCNDADYVGTWEGNGGNSLTVAADPTRPNVVWMTQANEIEGHPHTLLRSDDYGATWTPVGTGLPNGIPSGLSVDPHSAANARTLFITVDGDVYRSRDDGNTWTPVLDCDGCRYTAVDAHDGNLVYAGGEAGFWRSTEGGEPGTWEQTGLPEMMGTLGGEFWDVYWEGVAAIRPDPVRRGWVYVAAFGEGRGLYRSKDGGQSWERLLADDYLHDVAISPLDPDHLFAACSSALYSGGYDPASRGVLYSDDGGQTWTPFNEGLAWPFAVVLAVDPNPPHTLWLGSPGTGYHRRTLPSFTSEVYLPLIMRP